VILAWAALAPLFVQTAAMGFDELYFHRKRGLGAWERIGHPLDTLTVLACVAWALLAAPSPAHVAVYAALALVSCLSITKDEVVHARRCSAGEHWVHALLFIVHPLSLGSVAMLWATLHAPAQGWAGVLPGPFFGRTVLLGQLVVTASFCAYQAVYWNMPWTTRSQAAP
jgi:hypothetical protein